MVMEVDTSPIGMPSKSRSMSSRESTATPSVPTSPRAKRRVAIEAHQGRHVEGDGEAVLAVIQEVPEPLVGLRGRSVTGELAYRPEPAAVHVRVHAAGVRKLARIAELLVVVALDVIRRIEGFDRHARHGGELGVALRALRVRFLPAVLRALPGIQGVLLLRL